MDFPFGLFLLTLLTVASTEPSTICQLKKSADCSEMNVQCPGTLENLITIKDNECFTKPDNPVKQLTIGVEKVKDINALKETFNSLGENILSKVTSLQLINGDLEEVPDFVDKMTQIQDIDLSGNKIKSIDINKLINDNLNKINVSNNMIKELIVSESTKQYNVKEIILSDNLLETLPDKYFVNYKKVEILDLSHNNITDLSLGAFVGLKSLKKLLLSYNRLNNIGNYLLVIQNLEELRLDHNNLIIESDEDVFISLIKLKILNLSSNRISNRVFNLIKGLHNLIFLDLSNNNITSITKTSIKNNTNLNELYLADNQINFIVPEAFKGTNIHKFSLNNNELKGILTADILEGLNSEKLDLSHNGITEIGPNCFKTMVALKNVNLSHNNITKIDETAFKSNTNLEIIDISYNQLTGISFQADGLNKVTDLTIAHNKITDYKIEVIQNLKTLKKLDLSENEIKELKSKTFENSEKLEELDIHHNPVKKIEISCFDGLKELRTLNIAEMYLPSLEDGILSGLKKLEILDASRNKIVTIGQNAFKQNIELKKLLLNENEITDVSEVLKALINLEILNLSANNLKYVNASTFASLSHLIAIDVSMNKNLNLDSPFENLETLKNVNSSYVQKVTFKNMATSQIIEIDLSYCKIKDLNIIGLNDFQKLEKLNLCHNELTLINKDYFTSMRSLKNLSLCSNKIATIQPLSFENIGELEELDLSVNNLSEISFKTFHGLNKLKTLILSKNLLQSFPPGNLPHDESLTDLILDDNLIEHIDFEGFSLTNVKHLSIEGNRILCNETQRAKSKYTRFNLKTERCTKPTEKSTEESSTINYKNDNKLYKDLQEWNTYYNKTLHNIQQKEQDIIEASKKNEEIAQEQTKILDSQNVKFIEASKKIDGLAQEHKKTSNNFTSLPEEERASMNVLKTLSYISAFGVMAVISILAIKLIVKCQKKGK